MDRRRFLEVSAGYVAGLSTACTSQRTSVGDRRSQIEHLLSQLHERHLFTGEILVAEKGNVIY